MCHHRTTTSHCARRHPPTTPTPQTSLADVHPLTLGRGGGGGAGRGKGKGGTQSLLVCLIVRHEDRDPCGGHMCYPPSPPSPSSSDGYRPILCWRRSREADLIFVVRAGCVAGCGARGVRWGLSHLGVAVVSLLCCVTIMIIAISHVNIRTYVQLTLRLNRLEAQESRAGC